MVDCTRVDEVGIYTVQLSRFMQLWSHDVVAERLFTLAKEYGQGSDIILTEYRESPLPLPSRLAAQMNNEMLYET